MRRALSVITCALAVAGLAAGDAGAATHTPAKAKAKAKTYKSCRWVKRHGKRRRICVVHRVKAAPVKKPATTAPKAPAAQPPALGPGAPAPSAPPAGQPASGFSGAPSVPAPAPAPAPSTTPPARLQVTAREFTLTVSRTSVPAGSVITELVNRGEDPHDLHVRPAAGGADLLALPETLSGDVFDSDPTALPAGSYILYCSLPGHEQAGMRVPLTVR